jgi:hypothetical protein
MAVQPSSKARTRITINISGVTPGMRIGDLTVAQYVDLLQQVSDQLVAARLAEQPDIAKKAIVQIRKRVLAGVDQQLAGITDNIVTAQQAVLNAATKTPLTKPARSRTPIRKK